MREIKFRYWDTVDKEMRTVDNIHFPINDVVGTYMQYTGLKDKEGVPIYEGDLVERFCPHCEEPHWHGEIAWREEAAGFVFRDHEDKSDNPLELYIEERDEHEIDIPVPALLKVVGNVYGKGGINA